MQGFGQEVTVISTSPKKEREAREALGADHFVVSRDQAQMSVSAYSLDTSTRYFKYNVNPISLCF